MNPVQIAPNGTTSTTYFKSLSADMALTFALDPVSTRMDADREVLTFQIRPTEYNGGDIPVVAKGTLDPVPYFGKPRKNYAVKLRDASSQAIGKLIFNLTVTEVDAEDTEEVRRAARDSQSAARASVAGTPSRPPPPRSSTGSRNPSTDHSPTRPAAANAVAASTTSAERSPPGRQSSSPNQQHAPWRLGVAEEGNSPLPTPPKVVGTTPQPLATHASDQRWHNGHTEHATPASATPVSSAKRDAAVEHWQPQPQSNTSPMPPPPPRAPTVIESLHVVFERAAVKPEEVRLDRPAPFIIGATYAMKLRHGTTSFTTADMTCTRGREIPLLDQQTRLSLLADETAKLRFSLWENGKQVAGFSLSVDKFRSAVGQAKPYTIPFRYHPTNQMCTLELTVQRFSVPLDPVPRAPMQGTAESLRGALTAATSAHQPAGVPAPVAKVSPVKVLHHSPATNTAVASVPAPVPEASRERSPSSPPPYPVADSTRTVAYPAPPPPSVKTRHSPRRAPVVSLGHEGMHGHHARVTKDADTSLTTTTTRQAGQGRSQRVAEPVAVADTAIGRRVIEVTPHSAAPRNQPYVASLAGPSMWAAQNAQLRSSRGDGVGASSTPLRQRGDLTETASVAFPVESLAVPRIVPESRRAHSRDPSFTALGLPSEPQQTDPFARACSTPVRSFLRHGSTSRDRSLNSTPVTSAFSKDAPPQPMCRGGTQPQGRSAPSSATDTTEQHVAAVLARLDAMREERNRTPLFDRDAVAQPGSSQSRPSLLSEWQQWRDSRPLSRSGSAVSPYDPRRSPSLSSVVSRDDSVASVSSRRCSPLPTKSFAQHAQLRPVQTVVDDDALTHYRRRRGPTQ